jgi:hypothetical protein
MIGIFDILFEVFPFLIWGAGPFCVFKGMGTGKDSGKLLFKKIYTDSGVSITENATNLDFSVSGGGPPPDPIDTCEVAFGTGVGITSSVFYVDDTVNKCGLFGISNISTDASGNRNFSGEGGDTGTVVIGGYQNKIYDPYSENSLIVGGKNNRFWNYGPSLTSKQTVIIGSYLSYVKNYTNISENNFISGEGLCILGEASNNFISGVSSYIKYSNNSSSLGGTGNKVLDTSRSQTLGGTSKIFFGKGQSIQNGLNGISYGTYNSIQNGLSNLITQELSNQSSPFPYQNSILNGSLNTIKSGCANTILTGYMNCIVSYSYLTPPSSQYKYPTNFSTILNGKRNCITMGPNSAIVNGYKNEIFVSDLLSPASPGGVNYSANNVIMSGKNNKINWGSNNVSIFNDSGSINRSFRSKQFTSDSNTNADGATNSNNNIIAGGCLNRVSNSVLLYGGSEANSQILGSFSTSTVYTSSSNILYGKGIIQGTCDHNNNVIFNFTGGCNSQIKYADRSMIIGGGNNYIIANGTGSVTSAVILNSFGSNAVSIDGCCVLDSVIISGSASGLSHSYRSAIISSFQSRIEGGCLNSILNSSNSIIGKTDPKQSPRCQNCMMSIISSNGSNFCINGAGMNAMLNSVIIGLTGTSVRDTSNFTIVGNLHILGTVSVFDGTNKRDGVWFCQRILSTITQLVVCNGIVTSIT